MKGTKVLHVVNISFVLPFFIGDQFDWFRDKGIQFHVACSPDSFFFEYAKDKRFNPLPINILREINLLADIKAVLTLSKQIKKLGISVVIAHTPKGGLLGMAAAYLSGVKNRVYFRHGIMYETSTGLKRFLLKNIEKLTGRLATKVVCVSKSVMQVSIDERMNKASKNIILNRGSCNGIDAINRFNRMKLSNDLLDKTREQYGLNGVDKVLGYVGRLVKDKGIPELLAAWAMVVRKEPSAKLLLVGPYEDRDAISDEGMAYINQEKSIVHTGLHKDVVPFYGLMDIFILPSYREGFPTVVLEASAMEVPIITSRSTGCIDSIIENETGIFTDVNAEDIASKILYYFDNIDTAKQHGRNGRQFVLENFEQAVIWKEIEEKIFNN